MSDFLAELREELLDGLERHERRSARRRPAAPLYPGLLRPGTLVSAAAAAAILVAGLVALRDLVREAPATRPHVVAVLSIGGTPIDAAPTDGSLWITDYTGRLVQIDPNRRRVTARIKVPVSPSGITTDAGALWVQTAGTGCNGSLLRIEPSSRRIVGRVPLPYPSERLGALTGAGGGGVWVKRGFCSWRQEIDRINPTGAVTAHLALPNVDALATAAGTLWALDHDGTLTQIDEANGRIRTRWPQLAPLTLSDSTSWNTKALVADGSGVWVLNTRRDAILRIERGRIVRRLAVDASARPLLAQAPDGLWIATAERLGSNYRLIRIDAASGAVTGALKLGIQQPVALIPTGDQLCVLTGDGKILFIGS